MSILRMVLKEAAHRRLNAAMGLLAVAIATASFVGASVLLVLYDRRTEQILKRKEAEVREKMKVLKDDMRKAMLKLSFNLAIIPKAQDIREWHLKDYGTRYMPEEYVNRLAAARIVVARHYLPCLQQKVKWPEKNRTIILIGSRGEVPNLFKNPRKPLVQPVPAGTAVIGYEIHRAYDLKVGDKIRIMGREFTVHKCHKQRGSKDDISIWIPLKDAQELLGKKGLINVIMALECICFGENVTEKIRADIARVLPDTRVIEMGTKVLARAEARMRVKKEAKAAIEREKAARARLRAEMEGFASVLVPVMMAACAVWIAFLAFDNVRDRRAELGILRTLGFRSRQIMTLLLARVLCVALAGGAIGWLAGVLLGSQAAAVLGERPAAAASGLPYGRLFAMALGIACCLSVLAGWLPAMRAAAQDPADILREE